MGTLKFVSLQDRLKGHSVKIYSEIHICRYAKDLKIMLSSLVNIFAKLVPQKGVLFINHLVFPQYLYGPLVVYSYAALNGWKTT